MSESKERTFVGRIADAHIGDVRTLALSYLNRLDEIARLTAALAAAQAERDAAREELRHYKPDLDDEADQADYERVMAWVQPAEE